MEVTIAEQQLLSLQYTNDQNPSFLLLLNVIDEKHQPAHCYHTFPVSGHAFQLYFDSCLIFSYEMPADRMSCSVNTPEAKAWSSRTFATQNRSCQGQPKMKSSPVQHHIQSLAQYQGQLKAQICSALCGSILAPKQLSTVKYGGGSFVVCARVLQHWGTVIHEGKHEHFHPRMNCDVLKQSMIPFLHKLLCVAFFNMIITPNTPSRRRLPSWGGQR